jgi:hypothetical protein
MIVFTSLSWLSEELSWKSKGPLHWMCSTFCTLVTWLNPFLHREEAPSGRGRQIYSYTSVWSRFQTGFNIKISTDQLGSWQECNHKQWTDIHLPQKRQLKCLLKVRKPGTLNAAYPLKARLYNELRPWKAESKNYKGSSRA